MQDEKDDLFLQILQTFKRLELLDDLILVGSWCHVFYRVYFDDQTAVEAVRTNDIDFLIPSPKKKRPEKDVPAALLDLGFITHHSFTSGWTKYLHRELELEFLAAKMGRGEVETYSVKSLKVEAHTIRFLDYLEAHTITVEYKGIRTRVPEPAAYVLHKFLINPRRSEKKKIKDLDTVVKLSEYMVNRGKERKRFRALLQSMPASWQKIVLVMTKENAPWLHAVLTKK